MRIAFIAVKSILRGGGIEKYTGELGSRLVRRGHQVAVYSMTHYGQTPTSVAGMEIIAVSSLKTPCLQKMTASLSGAMHMLLHRSYDVVHLHSVASGSFGWLPRLMGVRTVLQMHGLEWQRDRWGRAGSVVLKLLEMAAVHQATAITAVSRKQCEYFQGRYGRHVDYIPTATKIAEKVAAERILGYGLKPDRYILFASRLVPEKGAHSLVRAFRQAKTDMRLVIAGASPQEDGYMRRLKQLAQGDSRIIFMGHVEGPLLAELFSNAYVYVQPSTIEGLSIALLEAMSYGRCCLVSNIAENLEAVSDCACSFQVDNIHDLHEKLQWLIQNSDYAQDIGARAMARVRRAYSWDSVVDKIEDLYGRVMSRQVRIHSSVIE